MADAGGSDLLKEIVKSEVARQMAISATSTTTSSTSSTNNSNIIDADDQSQRPSTRIQSIVQRARNLIQSNTARTSPALQNSGSFQPPKRRKISSRSYLTSQKKETPIELKSIELVLLRCADLRSDDEIPQEIIPAYNKCDDDICCTGMIEIPTNADEISIRSEIQEVLINRLPNIKMEDFDFVKVKGKKVMTPVFKKGQDIGYKQVKALVGQGALYVRLKNKETETGSHVEEDGNSLDVVIIPPPKASHEPCCSSGSSIQHHRSSTCTTPSPPGAAAQILQLQQMFPRHSHTYLEGVFGRCGSIHDAISTILSDQDAQGTASDVNEADEDDDLMHSPFESGSPSLREPLTKYREQVHNTGKQMITFNRFQLSGIRQLMALMKNPFLDLAKEPDVMFEGELGADLGGPKREFFSRGLQSLTKVDDAYNIQLFGGIEDHLVPLYGVDAISEGCFTMAGKLLAWSILHGGEGFVGLSPAVIEYMSTGSVAKAAVKVTVDDLPDIELKTIIEKATKDLADLTDEERDKIEGRMVSHGLSDIPLTALNKDKALKDLLTAEVIITRVLAMDTFFQGLDCLGLGKMLRSYPTIIGPLILPSNSQVAVHPEDVKAKSAANVIHTAGDNGKQEQILQWYYNFIGESAGLTDSNTGKSLLQMLVKFATGSWHVLCDDNWKVSFAEGPLLTAEACFNHVNIPTCHTSYTEFKKACITSLTFGAEGYGKF